MDKHEIAIWIARIVSLAAIADAYVISNAAGFGVDDHGIAWLGLGAAILTGLAQYLPRPIGEPSVEVNE